MKRLTLSADIRKEIRPVWLRVVLYLPNMVKVPVNVFLNKYGIGIKITNMEAKRMKNVKLSLKADATLDSYDSLVPFLKNLDALKNAQYSGLIGKGIDSAFTTIPDEVKDQLVMHFLESSKSEICQMISDILFKKGIEICIDNLSLEIHE